MCHIYFIYFFYIYTQIIFKYKIFFLPIAKYLRLPFENPVDPNPTQKNKNESNPNPKHLKLTQPKKIEEFNFKYHITRYNIQKCDSERSSSERKKYCNRDNQVFAQTETFNSYNRNLKLIL